jgi:hypothetical protein
MMRGANASWLFLLIFAWCVVTRGVTVVATKEAEGECSANDESCVADAEEVLSECQDTIEECTYWASLGEVS